jgi:tRNA1(Val) A37 N6-methylase TrmN6
VDYIVENTIGKIIEGKTPKEIEKIKILDPACGSGSFLIGAFQYVIDYHVAYYEKHLKEARLHRFYPELVEDGNGAHRLSIRRKARILHHNLFGVDLDPQAVEITMMNLYHKALEDERDLPQKQQLLPELKFNIVSANSLSRNGVEATFAEILKGGGFDAVIGNPPYLSVKRGFLSRTDYEYIRNHYKTATRQWDIYEVFLERALQLLRREGFWSFIIPKPFLTNENMEPGRALLLESTCIERIADCGTPFPEAEVEAVIIVARKTDPQSTHTVDIERLGTLGAKLASRKTKQGIFGKLPFKAFALDVHPSIFSLLRKIQCDSAPLGSLVSITRGIEAGKRDRSISTQPVKGSRRLLRGEDVSRFALSFSGLYVRPSLGDEAKFKSPEIYEVPKKILLRRVGAQLIAAVDTEKHWTLNTLYNIKPAASVAPELLAALLNSKLLNWWFRTSFVFEDRLFPYARISQIEQIPIRMLTNKPEHAGLTSALMELTQRLSSLKRKICQARSGTERQELEAEAGQLEQKVDNLVNTLYELTDDEVCLVERPRSELL